MNVTSAPEALRLLADVISSVPMTRQQREMADAGTQALVSYVAQMERIMQSAAQVRKETASERVTITEHQPTKSHAENSGPNSEADPAA